MQQKKPVTCNKPLLVRPTINHRLPRATSHLPAPWEERRSTYTTLIGSHLDDHGRACAHATSSAAIRATCTMSVHKAHRHQCGSNTERRAD
eukprot:5567393-Prymnesium_polylepis.1